jgi:hypothetical protein
LKKFSKTTETHVVHDQPVYVRGLYIMQNVYVCVLYREQGAYTSVNLKKKKKILDKQLGKGKLVGTWKVTRDPT